MPGTRDHDPLVIEDFQGLWERGDPESAPSDHFTVADNVKYFHSGVESRDGLVPYLNSPLPVLKFVRIYNYVTQLGQTLIALTTDHKIYHITGPTNIYTNPILTIAEMEDFGFVAINGRAYITPFNTQVNPQGEHYQLGLKNQFVYVYKGDGTPARKAGGVGPVGTPIVVANGTLAPAGEFVTDTGYHLFSVLYETDTGYLTAPGTTTIGVLNVSAGNLDGLHKLNFSNIPTSPNAYVIKRHLVATKEIIGFNGDKIGYQYFFIPGGTINDNTTVFLNDVAFFDSDLISDASHLFDNFSQIPAGVALNTYHSRLVVVGEFGLDSTFGTDATIPVPPSTILDNRSLARVSFPGEPEAISKVDGLIIAPLDGKPLTNVQEFRDVLYLFKNTRTIAYSDNFDVPASWQEEVLDQGIGAPVHGIATVLDTGGVNIDFLLIVDWSGLIMFNGTYAQPEMSWKIEDFWRGMNRQMFHLVQIVNDSLNKHIWITLPDPFRRTLLHADYANGMNAKDIRWAKWNFDVLVNTIALIETDRLVIGTPGLT